VIFKTRFLLSRSEGYDGLGATRAGPKRLLTSNWAFTSSIEYASWMPMFITPALFTKDIHEPQFFESDPKLGGCHRGIDCDVRSSTTVRLATGCQAEERTRPAVEVAMPCLRLRRSCCRESSATTLIGPGSATISPESRPKATVLPVIVNNSVGLVHIGHQSLPSPVFEVSSFTTRSFGSVAAGRRKWRGSGMDSDHRRSTCRASTKVRAAGLTGRRFGSAVRLQAGRSSHRAARTRMGPSRDEHRQGCVASIKDEIWVPAEGRMITALPSTRSAIHAAI